MLGRFAGRSTCAASACGMTTHSVIELETLAWTLCPADNARRWSLSPDHGRSRDFDLIGAITASRTPLPPPTDVAPIEPNWACELSRARACLMDKAIPDSITAMAVMRCCTLGMPARRYPTRA